jgi:hypothetical protein
MFAAPTNITSKLPTIGTKKTDNKDNAAFRFIYNKENNVASTVKSDNAALRFIYDKENVNLETKPGETSSNVALRFIYNPKSVENVVNREVSSNTVLRFKYKQEAQLNAASLFIYKKVDLTTVPQEIREQQSLEALNAATSLLMNPATNAAQSMLVDLFTSMGGWLWQNKGFILKNVLIATLLPLTFGFAYAYFMGGMSILTALELLAATAGSFLSASSVLSALYAAAGSYAKGVALSAISGKTVGQVLEVAKRSEYIREFLTQNRVSSGNIATFLSHVGMDIRNKTYEEAFTSIVQTGTSAVGGQLLNFNLTSISSFVSFTSLATIDPYSVGLKFALTLAINNAGGIGSMTKSLAVAGFKKSKEAAGVSLQAAKNIMKARAARGEVTLDADQVIRDSISGNEVGNPVNLEGEVGEMVDAVREVQELSVAAFLGENGFSVDEVTQSILEDSPNADLDTSRKLDPQLENVSNEVMAKIAIGLGTLALTGIALTQDPGALVELLQGMLPSLGIENLNTLALPSLLSAAETIRDSALARTAVTMTILKVTRFNDLIDSFANKLTPEQETKARSLAEMLRREKDASKIATYTKKFMNIITGKKYYTIQELKSLSLSELNKIAKTKGYTSKPFKKADDARSWIANAQNNRNNEILGMYNNAIRAITTGTVMAVANEVVSRISADIAELERHNDLLQQQSNIANKFAEAAARMGELDDAAAKLQEEINKKALEDWKVKMKAATDLTNTFKEAEVLRNQMKWRLENEVDIYGPDIMNDDFIVPPDVLEKIGKHDQYTPLMYKLAEIAAPRVLDAIPILNTASRIIDGYNLANEVTAVGTQLYGVLNVIGTLKESIEIRASEMSPATFNEDIDSSVKWIGRGAYLRTWQQYSLGKAAADINEYLKGPNTKDSLKSLTVNLAKGAILEGWDTQRVALELSKGLVLGSDYVGKDITFGAAGKIGSAMDAAGNAADYVSGKIDELTPIINQLTAQFLDTLAASKGAL